MFGFPVGGLSKANNGMQNRPILDLNFAQTGALDSRITFTRNSNATHFNSSGTLTVASANTPRFDYDPVTLAARGMLIEEQRTNLLTYSEQFDNAAWTKSNASITANAVAAPDGQTTADAVVENTATASHIVYAAGITASTQAISVFAKRNGRDLAIDVGSAGNGRRVVFNLANGTVSADNQVVGTGGTVSSLSASIQNAGNGWYRCVAISVSTGTNTLVFLTASGTSVSYTGDGTSGIYIWGAQLEAGSFATSYIPTTSAQATRIADSATMTGTNFSSWYNASEGTLYGEADTYSAAINCGIVSPNDGTANNRMQLFGETNAAVSWYATAGGVNSMWISSGNRTANSVFKVAGAYATNNAAASLNGAAAITDSSVTIPTVNRLSIGALYSGVYLNGHIKRIAYYPRRLTNAELQGITT